MSMILNLDYLQKIKQSLEADIQLASEKHLVKTEIDWWLAKELLKLLEVVIQAKQDALKR